jgi:hypothetical protein
VFINEELRLLHLFCCYRRCHSLKAVKAVCTWQTLGRLAAGGGRRHHQCSCGDVLSWAPPTFWRCCGRPARIRSTLEAYTTLFGQFHIRNDDVLYFMHSRRGRVLTGLHGTQFGSMAKLPTLLEVYNVRVVGMGEEIVVLGHSLATDQTFWQHFIPHLQDDYCVILFNNMAASTTDPQYFSFSRYSTLDGNARRFTLHSGGARSPVLHLRRPLSRRHGRLSSVTNIITISASPRYDLIPTIIPCNILPLNISELICGTL